MTFLFSKTERYLRNLLNECRQTRGYRFLKKGYLIILTSLLIIGLVVISFSGMSVLSTVNGGIILSGDTSFSDISPSIVQDAKNLSSEIYKKKSDAEFFYQQLLTVYKESKDKNVVIIFSPGGWGTKTLEDSSDWMSILKGMQNELTVAGYNVFALNYQRTTDDLRGQLHELEELVAGYYSKASDLAVRVNFLTEHNPDLKVILAGESTGTMICDSAMNLLKENTRVYSVQTGTPFWQKNTIRERTIVVNDNGVIPDAFARGDLVTVVKSSFKALMGDSTQVDNGTIMNIFSAPGHEYWWQNPKVSFEIGLFLEEHFKVQSNSQVIK
jgi:hypothetical protein